jgi:hypothetical protein
MRRVRREEIVDHVTYAETREAFRREVLAVKGPRRVHLGPDLTVLFENTLTVRYQVQEMMRAEHIVREADIRHEIDTYNELLGGPGELGATLLIEIDDPAVRAVKLAAWRGLPERVYLELPDGSRAYARFDPRQGGEERLSSVQYLVFDVRGRTPVAAGVDLPGVTHHVPLTPEQQAALAADLRDDAAA